MDPRVKNRVKVRTLVTNCKVLGRGRGSSPSARGIRTVSEAFLDRQSVQHTFDPTFILLRLLSDPTPESQVDKTLTK